MESHDNRFRFKTACGKWYLNQNVGMNRKIAMIKKIDLKNNVQTTAVGKGKIKTQYNRAKIVSTRRPP